MVPTEPAPVTVLCFALGDEPIEQGTDHANSAGSLLRDSESRAGDDHLPPHQGANLQNMNGGFPAPASPLGGSQPCGSLAFWGVQW